MNEGKLAAIAFVVLILLCFGSCGVYHASEATVTIAVTDKAAMSKQYLVFSKEEVFGVDDTVTFMDFRASDRFNSIEKGKTYRCRVAGWRLPFFSAYRNILEAKEVR